MRARALVALDDRVGDRCRRLRPPRRRARRCCAWAGRRSRRPSPRSSTRTRRTSASGRSTTTCSSTSAPRTSARPPASPRAGTSRPTRRRSPSSCSRGTSGPTARRSPRRTSSTASRRSRPNSLLFPSYVENISSVDTPDANTVIVKTKKPDARIVGGLFVYILPEHVWGKQSVKSLSGSFRPTPPLVGSGPYIVTAFDRGRLIRMTRNPNFRGEKPAFDEVQWIKYGNDDAVERALTLGEIDLVPEVQQATFARLKKTANIKAVSSPSPSFTQLTFNLCNQENCPDAKFNPAVQDARSGRRSRTRSTASGSTRSPSRGTAFEGHGLLPDYYKAFYSAAGGGLPARRRPCEPAARRGGLGARRRRRRARQGRHQAVLRPVRALGVAGEHPGRAARARDDGADRRRLQGPGRLAWTS